MKIGIFGGTFDPIRNGHLAIAEMVADIKELDEVWIVPNGNPPHRDAVASARDRYHMVQESVRGNPRLKVSNEETFGKGPRYTVDLVRSFRKRHPSDEIFLIIGFDEWEGFEGWRAPSVIRSIVDDIIVVYPNESEGPIGIALTGRGAEGVQSVCLRGIRDEHSSTIRSLMRKRISCRYLIPEPAWSIIRERGLYRGLKGGAPSEGSS